MIEEKRESTSKAIAKIKTRKWTKQLVTVGGSMQIMKWVPNREKATAELQIHNNNDHGHLVKKSRRKASGPSRGRSNPTGRK